MSPYFFRVEHDLLRSESFRTLGGSAVKVYLVIGLYSDFGTDWAYPSIRTIARQAGLSRQTVLVAVEDLTRLGLLATSKSKGRSTAYKIIRQPSGRPPSTSKKAKKTATTMESVPEFLEEAPLTGLESLGVTPETGPDFGTALAQFLGLAGPEAGPNPEPGTREEPTSIPIPGTPFRLSAEGRLLVAVDLQELLTNQGIPRQLAERLAAQKAPEDVAKVLLNAFYLQSQGKLQNGPGYIRAGLEGGYDLLPQVANRLESRRQELAAQLRAIEVQRQRHHTQKQRLAEEAAINLVIERLAPAELDALVRQAVATLPEPIVRRNPTLSNPFVRGKVYELAGGEPLS
jgi:DNA-binding transcriptional regulator YhcF (GntR family)